MFDFNEVLKDLNITLTTEQLKQFELYYNFLVEYNEKVNLTAITKIDEVYIKHFYDCLTLVKVCDFTKVSTFCDVGAGAGFPSIPVKILYPHLKLTIVEGLNKRITFLKQLTTLLKLDNCEFVHARAEEYGRTIAKETFDVVSARAVARLNILNELCLPLVKVGGIFLSMKAKEAKEEYEEGQSLKKLKAKIIDIQSFDLPLNFGSRTIIKMEHFAKMDNLYPREYSKIKKNPL